MTEQRADMLISLVIDGTAKGVDWNELTVLAERDPTIWRDLAESQRHQAVLSRTLNEAVSIADQIAAPSSGSRSNHEKDVLAPRRGLGAWSGWAVAAVVAVAALANQFGMLTGSNGLQTASNGMQTAGVLPTMDTALDDYLRLGREEGRVVGELPSKVIVSSQPNPNGEGFELICLQQIVIRQIVPDLFEVTGQDEQGQLLLQQFKPDPSAF